VIIFKCEIIGVLLNSQQNCYNILYKGVYFNATACLESMKILKDPCRDSRSRRCPSLPSRYWEKGAKQSRNFILHWVNSYVFRGVVALV